MRLPKDILSETYIKPKFFLCETNKERICQLNTYNSSGVFKFNSMSELSFDVPRIYNNVITGETNPNPFYDKIEALRLIELENFGYFELQGPELTSDGIQEVKSCTAYSLEYTLSQKYLEDFYINLGTVNSMEVLNAASENKIVPITLYNPTNTKLSLLHLALEKIYGWKIGHVDASLQTLSRQFEIDRESVYDFLTNEVCEKFNCYIIFDTINNKINVYAESLTAKFIGDGKTNAYTISPPFKQVNIVSVDGYKTTRWAYDAVKGLLVLEDIPVSGAHIEVVDGALTEWETDVFVTFENLSQEININYDADSIKTVLTVTYGNDYDIREINLGLPYITDLSYYYTVDWMGQDLYDAYKAYLQKTNESQAAYTENSQEIFKFNDCIYYEENRLSLKYSLAESVHSGTVGTYYTREENSDGSYYYKEVSLPRDYNVDVQYYSNATTNVNEDKISKLYKAIQKYFYNYFNKKLQEEKEDKNELYETYVENMNVAIQELEELNESFSFITSYTITDLSADLKNESESEKKEEAIKEFLKQVWVEIGRTPLKELYLKPYEAIKETDISAGYSKPDSINYGNYYPCVILIESINSAIAERDATIKKYEDEKKTFQDANGDISNQLLMSNNFTEDQLIRLNSFLREDELHLDDIVETSLDNLSSSFKIKQDAMDSGRIELQKLCQPQLQFSMTMANIYALPEFEPIIDQFQLGNVIRVGLRPDYIKQSRLLEVNINFDDFSDFSCEFGELTSLRNQSDIHADLLSKAISAGKSVATNSNYWTRGSDQATAIDLKIRQGLLDATTQIKSIDGTQGVVIDKYGILLQKLNDDGSADPHQTRLVNNMILMTDDGWKTSRAGLGQFTVDNQEMYGLIAEAVLSGYIEGSDIIGGTIRIGLQDDGSYAFEVHEDGTVTMNGGSSLNGYVTDSDFDDLKQYINDTKVIASSTTPENAKDGQMWLDTSIEPYELKILNNGKWVYFEQQSGGKIYTSKPNEGEYSAGDIWILSSGETYTDSDGISYSEGSILKANDELKWTNVISDITQTIANVKQYFEFNQDKGLKIGQKDEKFYVNISSTEMGFYDNTKQNAEKVVSISNSSARIKNAVFDGDAKFENNVTVEGQINMYQPDSTTGFTWKIEKDGSLSLAIST